MSLLSLEGFDTSVGEVFGLVVPDKEEVHVHGYTIL